MGESKHGHFTDVFPEHQGGAGTLDTCPASPPHPVSTEDPDYQFPPSFLFCSGSFPEFFFAILDVGIGLQLTWG